ncbi:MAG: hypothetical protein IKI65_00145, partial [Firmicutes bacterium]|nr:hypothetical protein [Bacillota bacterium]
KVYSSNQDYFDYPNYNFADRRSSNKDRYSVLGQSEPLQRAAEQLQYPERVKLRPVRGILYGAIKRKSKEGQHLLPSFIF